MNQSAVWKIEMDQGTEAQMGAYKNKFYLPKWKSPSIALRHD
jgi:hypothetical protein